MNFLKEYQPTFKFADRVIHKDYYKCPHCKGEFNKPALDHGYISTHYGNPRCPFCNYSMQGLR